MIMSMIMIMIMIKIMTMTMIMIMIMYVYDYVYDYDNDYVGQAVQLRGTSAGVRGQTVSVRAAMSLTAAELQLRYGAELVRPPLCDAKSPYLLQKLLEARGIRTTHAACRTWWGAYRQVPLC